MPFGLSLVAVSLVTLPSDLDARELELRAQWSQLQSFANSEIYRPTLLSKSPIQPERVPSANREDAIRYLNFLRDIAGVRPAKYCDPELNDRAQWGSVIMGLNRSIGHSLPKPINLNSANYLTGSMGLAQGNLAVFRGRRATLRDVIDEQMRAPGQNIFHAGHRRWLLNPGLGKVGIGLIQPDTELATYSVIIANDASEMKQTVPDYIAWPAAGPFPIELVRAEMPWTISLNPRSYKITASTRITVDFEANSSNRRWQTVTTDPVSLSKKTFSDHINRQGFGWQNCVIVRPPADLKFNENDFVTIRLAGLTGTSGELKEILYTTKFIRLENPSQVR